jgi:hypothetical protein
LPSIFLRDAADQRRVRVDRHAADQARLALALHLLGLPHRQQHDRQGDAGVVEHHRGGARVGFQRPGGEGHGGVEEVGGAVAPGLRLARRLAREVAVDVEGAPLGQVRDLFYLLRPLVLRLLPERLPHVGGAEPGGGVEDAGRPVAGHEVVRRHLHRRGELVLERRVPGGEAGELVQGREDFLLPGARVALDRAEGHARQGHAALRGVEAGEDRLHLRHVGGRQILDQRLVDVVEARADIGHVPGQAPLVEEAGRLLGQGVVAVRLAEVVELHQRGPVVVHHPLAHAGVRVPEPGGEFVLQEVADGRGLLHAPGVRQVGEGGDALVRAVHRLALRDVGRADQVAGELPRHRQGGDDVLPRLRGRAEAEARPHRRALQGVDAPLVLRFRRGQPARRRADHAARPGHAEARHGQPGRQRARQPVRDPAAARLAGAAGSPFRLARQFPEPAMRSSGDIALRSAWVTALPATLSPCARMSVPAWDCPA